MAQPMMHLLIADKIYTEKFGSIHSYSDLLLGSIAPDAVHVKENYTRELKDISHYGFNSKSHISYFDTFKSVPPAFMPNEIDFSDEKQYEYLQNQISSTLQDVLNNEKYTLEPCDEKEMNRNGYNCVTSD